MTRLKEPIKVVASFGMPYKVRPVRFRWGERLLDVREITYTWTTMEGKCIVYHFAVSNGESTYELSFNSSSLIWNIEGAGEEI